MADQRVDNSAASSAVKMDEVKVVSMVDSMVVLTVEPSVENLVA